MNKRLSVCKSFTIPFEGKFVREVSDEDREFWKELVTVYLRKFLKFSIELVNKIRGGALESEERLELVADLISFFFKAPLTSDPLLSLMPSPYRLSFILRIMNNVHKAFLSRPIPDDLLIKTIRNVEQDLERDGKNPLTYMYSKEVMDKIQRAWLIFPADTRPGANTASLITHLLTTSSIAWSLAYQSGFKDNRQLAFLRIVSQIHDIAKPLEPRKHYRTEVYGELVDSLFDDILTSTEIKELKDAIKSHHLDSSSPIHEADNISSAIDRLKEVVKNAMKEKFNTDEFKDIVLQVTGSQQDPLDLAYGVGKEAWMFWEELENRMPGKTKELSENFVKWLRKQSEIKVNSSPHYAGLSYFLIDIRDVQGFVYYTHKLNAVAAASLFVDYLTSFIIPLYVQLWFRYNNRLWIPQESFLLTSGANIAGILPSNLTEDFRSSLESLSNLLREFRIGFHLAIIPFRPFYPHLWKELNKEMALRKIIPKLDKFDDDLKSSINPSKLCRLCFKQDGRQELEPLGLLCDICYRLFEFGRVLGFSAKWYDGFILEKRIIPNDIWKMEYGDEKDPNSIASNMIELISGMDPPFSGRDLNVSIIKGDGNRMGEFFSKSISITDALERSFRVDQSLKMSYEKALWAILSVKHIEDDELKKDVCRIWLGTLYMGGDDFLIICPSWLSLPFAYVFAKEFEQNMGGECTLSMGIAVTPPKHSIWHSIGAADELMEQAKKKVGRKGPTSAVSFDVIEQGILSAEIARNRLERQREYGLTVRPMPFYDESKFSLKNLLHIFGYNLECYDPVTIMQGAYLHKPSIPAQINQVSTRLKYVRNVVREAITSVISMLGRWDESNKDIALQLSTLYCYRESVDRSRHEDLKQVFGDVADIVVRHLVANEGKRLQVKRINPRLSWTWTSAPRS